MGFIAINIKPLLVGMNNPYSSDPRYDLYPLPVNASGSMLVELFGIKRGDYLRFFDRTNLCRGAWSMKEARAAADDIKRRRRSGPIVLLGRQVAEAFDMKTAGYFVKRKISKSVSVYVMPHPSGLCRLWNDIENRKKALDLFRKVLLECERLTNG